MTNFNTQDYDFLLRTLNQGSLIFKSQSLKRLLMLAINDKKQFTPICKQVLYQLQSLYDQEKQDISLNATLIVSEIVSTIPGKQFEYSIMNNHIESIIQNLGHVTKPNVRKASHTLLLAILRSYNNFNLLARAYTQFGILNDNPLVRQKAINSFQSIVILELKKFDWRSEESKKLIQVLVLKTLDQNTFVAKAAAQCLISLSKIQDINFIAQKLSIGYLTKFKEFLQNAIQTLNATSLKILPQDIQNLMQGHKKVKKSQQQPIKMNPQIRKTQRPAEKDMETIRFSNVSNQNNNNTQRRLDKIRNSIKNQSKKSNMIQKEPIQSKLFGNLVLEGSIKQKTESAEELLFKIQANIDKPQFASSIKQLLPNLIKMLKDTNPKIVGIMLKILQIVISFVNPQDKNFLSLLGVIVEKLGDAKISIRQSVSKVIKELIHKTKKGIWIHQLLQNMKKNTNTFVRDQTLALILNIFEQTPRQQIDYNLQSLLESIVIYSDDPKTKIKIRTLDCLAQIVFVSQESQKYNESLKSKMPTIFYQMYIQKVNKLQKQYDKDNQERSPSKKIKQQFSTTSRTAYNYQNEQINPPTSSDHKRNQSSNQNYENEQLSGNKFNVSMQIVKRRVSLLKKPRNLMSTQQTSSVDNYSQKTIDRTLDNNENNMEDIQVILPSLYKKTTTTGRFINRSTQRSTFSPNKTIEHNNKSMTSTGDYLSKEELTPLNEPQKQFKQLMNSLKSSDWKALFQITNKLRRLIQFDSQVIKHSDKNTMHNLIMDILAMVENLRSSVSKNALLCLNQLIIVLGKQVDSQTELIFDRVIKKAADTNVFISAEVQKVMSTLSLQVTSSKILQKISQCKDSKNIPIKQTCVNVLLSMRQQKRIRQKQYIKLTQSFSYFLFDGNQEVRNKAKNGIILLCNDLGDWYRAIRGKINPGYFKSICQLMTKPQQISLKDKNIQQNNQRYKTLVNTPKKSGYSVKEDYSTIKSQRNPEPILKLPSPQKQPAKKRLIKISNFPQEFESLQQYIEQCNSSDWKKRIECLNNIKDLALQYENQFIQYKSANHFIDIVCKQISQPNLKVSLNAMMTLQEIQEPLRTLVENNLSLVCNSLFNSLSSNKPQIKQKAEQVTQLLLGQIQLPSILQYLSHGILYSLPKSRIYLLNKLKQKLEEIFEKKKQLLFKYIFPLMNKLMQEYKTQLMQNVVGVFNKLFDLMGNQMYSHLTKFKEVKQLINR